MNKFLIFSVLTLATITSGFTPEPINEDIIFDPNDYCMFLISLVRTPGYIPEFGQRATTENVQKAAQWIYDGWKSVPAANFETWGMTHTQTDNASQKLSEFAIQLPSSCKDKIPVKTMLRGFPDSDPVINGQVPDFHPYDKHMEGEISSPYSHQLVWNSNKIKVVNWDIIKSYEEPFHTHAWFSLSFVTNQMNVVYHTSNDNRYTLTIPTGYFGPHGPSWLHSMANLENQDGRVVQVFFKPLTTPQYIPSV